MGLRSVCYVAALGCALGQVPSNSVADESLSTTVPLIKLEYPGNPPNIRMLYIRLLALGDRKVNQPLLFDTGSAGITVECDVVLPVRLCSEDGIKIKENLELEGMTVTTEQAVMHYGIYDEYGNIAFARVKFGSRKQPVATKEAIQVLIRYKTVRRSTGEVVGGPLWPKGTFGISPVGGGGPDRQIRSPIHAILPADGMKQGFYLSPIGKKWKVCTNEQRNCPEVNALHIGISETVAQKFEMRPWDHANSNYNFPTVDACIESDDYSVCGPTLYDTGNSTIMVKSSPPLNGDQSLDVGVGVKVVSKVHTPWAFRTTYKPEVEFVPRLKHNILGIRYFETNGLLIDVEGKQIGFTIAQ